MALFRVDISRETGEVMLWMESRCGLKPVMGWPSMEGLKEFAEMLLDVYCHRNRETDKIREVSDNIIKQALGNKIDFLKEDSND